MYLINRKLVLALPCASFAFFNKAHAWQNPLKYVYPHIGSRKHGRVDTEVGVRYGAVQAVPNNINNGWDWCPVYYYSGICIIFNRLNINQLFSHN